LCLEEKSYKEIGKEEKRIMTGMHKVMLPRISLTDFTCESWDTQLERESGSSTLRGDSWEL
jgi:hypothetical protein